MAPTRDWILVAPDQDSCLSVFQRPHAHQPQQLVDFTPETDLVHLGTMAPHPERPVGDKRLGDLFVSPLWLRAEVRALCDRTEHQFPVDGNSGYGEDTGIAMDRQEPLGSGTPGAWRSDPALAG